ncbi:MAG: hypothetical protein U5K79_05295 [Cyclobacteriaceae bacterium]|nr:hypothetical protein [Cyclobacteriaceae bacterium]
MMQQLGTKASKARVPAAGMNQRNHANYDESLANPCPQLPDVLTTNGGKKVTSPEMWWNHRRPEIYSEDFERKVSGRFAEEAVKEISSNS